MASTASKRRSIDRRIQKPHNFRAACATLKRSPHRPGIRKTYYCSDEPSNGDCPPIRILGAQTLPRTAAFLSKPDRKTVSRFGTRIRSMARSGRVISTKAHDGRPLTVKPLQGAAEAPQTFACPQITFCRLSRHRTISSDQRLATPSAEFGARSV